MKGWPVIALLLLAGCGGQSESKANRDDKLIEEAKALEKRANDQVNETIATIEAENRDAMAEVSANAPEVAGNDVESATNQN